MNSQTDRQTAKRTDKQPNGQTNSQTDRQTAKRTDKPPQSRCVMRSSKSQPKQLYNLDEMKTTLISNGRSATQCEYIISLQMCYIAIF